ncbi:MAG TPA: lytic transglycosylase domain-containing protein [Thermoanaerobaculia bacterium]|nr:lytic transglycosylase domain-containing protein [Thermoanaerobaculia bacterium]
MAVLASIPLAFAAIDMPSDARTMNLTVLRGGDLQQTQTASIEIPKAAAAPLDPKALPIFTTQAMRSQFFLPKSQQRPFTLDVFREDYFRAHVPYGDIIHREAVKNHLPPELVAAMVHTESDFRASLVSHKSAQGLMQIVPSTARILGVDDPFDPEKNIAAGTKYFRYLLDRFEDERIALAAYNAGEGNVARFGGVPPFTETQSYIEKVHRRAARYRSRVQTSYMASVRMRLAEN